MKQFLLIISLSISLLSFAQNTDHTWHDKIDLSGYIKYLNILSFHNGDDLRSDNLWHNRLNLAVYLNDKLTFKASLRNRLLYGEQVQNPFYRATLKMDDGLFDLTSFIIDKQKLLLISQFDRLNFEYIYKNVDISLGRQRINWGKNLVWNPNDIFNTANFLDLDYEERAGVDALRFRYNLDDFSQVDLVYSASNNFESSNTTAAVAFHSVYKTYDYQILAGYIMENYVLGTGWEGNLGQFGFKGETSYFINLNKANVLVSSLSWDYAFKRGQSWLFSVLYNGGFKNNPSAFVNLLSSKLNVQNIFPSDWTFYNQFSGNFGPAWYWSMGILYGKQNNLVVVMPTLNYTISDNWEINIYAQSFFADIIGMTQQNMLTFRLRYDF